MAAFLRIPGLVSALVGGVLGGVAGVLLGNLLSDQVRAGDLSDIGTGLVLLLAGLLVGPSAGATIALTLRNHERAVATGLLTGPLVTLAMIGAIVVLGFFAESDSTFLFALILLLFGVAAIWLARWLATS